VPLPLSIKLNEPKAGRCRKKTANKQNIIIFFILPSLFEKQKSSNHQQLLVESFSFNCYINFPASFISITLVALA
jgi:hypothetical protein